MAETEPLLPEKKKNLQPMFASAQEMALGRKFPQAIAHRGYKAAHPENTMGAFKGAVDVGAHSIETDLHISKDGVVVISHDPDLKRCYGKRDKIIDCDWNYLKTLRTLKEPHEPMPRLKDLLEFLTTPGLEEIWVLLDIKLDNNSDDIMRLIAETLAEVKSRKPWEERIMLGCWAAKYLPLCSKYLPGYPIAHIGFSIPYALQFLKVPNVSFNMHHKVVAGPGGSSFLREAKAAGRSIFLWTVNDVAWMKWSIGKEVDGVITDDPKKYLEVCKNYGGEKVRLPLRKWGSVIWINIIAALFSLLFRSKYGFKINIEKVKKSLEA